MYICVEKNISYNKKGISIDSKTINKSGVCGEKVNFAPPA